MVTYLVMNINAVFFGILAFLCALPALDKAKRRAKADKHAGSISE